MNYELVNSSDPHLKHGTYDFNFAEPQIDPQELAENLANVMIENNGVGLAAPQVGISLSAFVVGDPKNRDSIRAFFNPKIVDMSGDEVYIEEGCLSFPGLFVKVKRPSEIRIRYQNVQGETITEKFSGFTARIIQHEYDHLQGIVFTSKANRIHLNKARKDQKLLQRKLKRKPKVFEPNVVA